MAMTNLEKASKAYNKLMCSIGEDSIAELIKEDMLEASYTIDDLVCNVEYHLELDTCEDANYLDYLENYGTDDERKQHRNEIRRLKNFIKKWKGVE